MIKKVNVSRSRSSGFGDALNTFTNKNEESLLRVMPSARREAPSALLTVKTRYFEKKKNRSPESIAESFLSKRINNTDQSHLVVTLPAIKAGGGTSDTINTTLKRHVFGSKSISARDRDKLDGSDEYMQVDLLTTDTTIQTKQRRKIPIEKDTTATIVAFSPENVIIHPKFMQKRGSMCICELWHGKDKQRVANKYPEKIIDGSRVPIAEISKDNIGIFRPQKLEMEIKTLRRIHDNKLNMDVDQNPIYQAFRQVEPTMLSRKKLFPESRKKSPSDPQQSSRIIKNLNSQEILIIPSLSMPDGIGKPNTIISVADERKFIAQSPDLASKEASPDIRPYRRSSIENQDRSVSKEYGISPDIRGFPNPEVSEIVMKLETNAIDSMVLLPEAERASPQESRTNVDLQTGLEPYFNQKSKDTITIRGLLNIQKASGNNESPSDVEGKSQAEQVEQVSVKPIEQENISKQKIVVTTSQRQARGRKSIGQDKSPIIYPEKSNSKIKSAKFKAEFFRNFVCKSLEKVTDIQLICKENAEAHREIEKGINKMDKNLLQKLSQMNKKIKTYYNNIGDY